jgi:SAM-dependent methyltransferase
VSVSYASHTFDDPNPIKRLLHRHRFPALVGECPVPPEGKVLDFGCGDGRLFRILIDQFGVSSDRLTGFDPNPDIQPQFRALVPEAEFVGREEDIQRPEGGFEAIFCFEVFEHLTRKQTERAVPELARLISPTGLLYVEVPIEVGPPGFLKNIYRRVMNDERIPLGLMLRSLVGLKVERQPRILPDGSPTFEHPGYSFAQTRRDLQKRFVIEREFSNPFPILPFFINNVRVFSCRRIPASEAAADC